MRRIVKVLLVMFLMSFAITSFAENQKTPTKVESAKKTAFSQRKDVQKFIKMMVTKYHFKKSNLEDIFDQVQIQPAILKIMARPAEKWDWYKYQEFFITTDRINSGVNFWNDHAKTLSIIEKRDHIPASVIVAIIGVETFYGQNQGSYRVLDSLTTLAFEYPKRAKFFQSELKEYLLLARENQFNVTSMLGSYAGAIGQGQFMPSSYRSYAIDYNGKGESDLRNDTDDVIASVGNYLKEHGWDKDKPIAVEATVTGSKYKKLRKNTLKPRYSLGFLKKYGVVPVTPYNNKLKTNFMILNGAKTPQYWLGFHNFYVISRYNPRINYAMAVYQLSVAISKARTLNSH